MPEGEENPVALKLHGTAKAERAIPSDPMREAVLETCFHTLRKVPTNVLIAWLPVFGQFEVLEGDDDGG